MTQPGHYPKVYSKGPDTRIPTCQEQVRTADAPLCLITSQHIPDPGSMHPKSAQTTDAPEYPDGITARIAYDASCNCTDRGFWQGLVNLG